MPDPQQDNSQPVQQQGGMINGGQAGISGGTNFFGNLVSTLVRGAVQGGVAALGANQSNPKTRSMAAGINASQVNQQKQQQQAAEQDESTLRAQRIAMGQVYALQAKHMLSKADNETRDSAYNTQASYFDQLDQQGLVDWTGGTAEDPTSLQQELQKQKQTHPQQDVRIVGKGGSTPDKPLFQVAVVRRGNLLKDIEAGGIAGVGKLPPMQITGKAGTDAADSVVAASHDGRNGIMQNQQVQNQKPLPTNSPMISQGDFQKQIQDAGYAPIKNLANIYAFATEGDDSGLPKTTTRGRDGIEYSKDDAEELIRTSGMWPDFDPKRAAEDKDTIKRLQDYYHGNQTKDWESASAAHDFASDILKDNPKNPRIRELAQALTLRASTLMAQYPTPKEKLEATKQKSADTENYKLEGIKQKAIVPINHVIEQDQGKFQDFAEAIHLLDNPGGEQDAIAKIAALRGTVGGGGVRITGAELNSIGSQARSWMGDVEVWLSRASTDPSKVESLTAPQRTQLKDVLNNSYKLLSAKNDAYAEASTNILGATSLKELNDAQIKLVNGLRAPKIKETPTGPQPPKPEDVVKTRGPVGNKVYLLKNGSTVDKNGNPVQ